MSEDTNTKSFFKRILSLIFKSPVSLLFIGAILWFLAKIYIIGQDTLLNKAYLIGICGLWIFWFVAKSFFKILLLILFAAGLFLGYYYLTNYNEITCKNNGGYWNSELTVCEEKLNMWQQIQKWWKNK